MPRDRHREPIDIGDWVHVVPTPEPFADEFGFVAGLTDIHVGIRLGNDTNVWLYPHRIEVLHKLP